MPMYKKLRQRRRQNEGYKEADKERMDQGDEKSMQTQKKERKNCRQLLRDCGWSADPSPESARLSGVFSLQHTSRGRSTQLAENTADALQSRWGHDFCPFV